ncbi:MAG: NADH-quinone oxidoreductase subunit N [Longimicrobiales bacterium]
MNLDYSSLWHYTIALLPELVLSASAMLILLIDVFQKGEQGGQSRPLIGWLALAGIALTALANGFLLRVTEPTTTAMMAIDSFRVFVNFIFLMAAALFVLIAARYLEEEQIRLGELYVLILLSTVGMMVFAGSRDLMVIFIGLEMTSVPVYVLTGVKRRDRRSAEGALKYFLLGAFSSAFFLFGVALVYGGTGTTNLPQIAAAAGVDGVAANAYVLVGIALLIVGFAFKVAAVPFHMWTPDAYEGAPAPITGFMAAAVKAAAFAAFLRVFLGAFSGLYDVWNDVVFWLAVVTMITANLVALVQNNVKRMLAYSSIAHAGYLLVALAAANQLGAASFLFYLVVYTLMTLGSFAVVLAVGRAGEERLDIESYSGLAWQKPLIGVIMTIFLLSLAGFPFTGGFIGKVFILRAALEKGLIVLAVVLVLASLVSYWYYLRVAWYMWFRDAPATTQPALSVSGPMRVALIAAALGVVLLGLLPGELLEAAEKSAGAIVPAPASMTLGR